MKTPKPLTWGGLPAGEALSGQKLAHAHSEVYARLLSDDPKVRRQAYVDYYALSRRAMRDEWLAYIATQPDLGGVLLDICQNLIMTGKTESVSTVPIINQNQKEVIMTWQEKLTKGLALIGEGIIEMSEPTIVTGKTEKIEIPAEVEPPKAAKPPKTTPVTEAKAAEPVVEAITSKELVAKVGKCAAKDRPATIAALGAFGAKKLGDVKEEDYPALNIKLDAILA
jgi:hypothetical protein